MFPESVDGLKRVTPKGSHQLQCGSGYRRLLFQPVSSARRRALAASLLCAVLDVILEPEWETVGQAEHCSVVRDPEADASQVTLGK